MGTGVNFVFVNKMGGWSVHSPGLRETDQHVDSLRNTPLSMFSARVFLWCQCACCVRCLPWSCQPHLAQASRSTPLAAPLPSTVSPLPWVGTHRRPCAVQRSSQHLALPTPLPASPQHAAVPLPRQALRHLPLPHPTFSFVSCANESTKAHYFSHTYTKPKGNPEHAKGCTWTVRISGMAVHVVQARDVPARLALQPEAPQLRLLASAAPALDGRTHLQRMQK